MSLCYCICYLWYCLSRPTRAFLKLRLVWRTTENWEKWWTRSFSTQKWSILWWRCWLKPQIFPSFGMLLTWLYKFFYYFFFNCPCKCNYLNSTLCREIGQWKNWLEFLVSSRISLEKVFMNIYRRYSPSSHIIDQESFADFSLILFCKKCKFFAVPMWQMSK